MPTELEEEKGGGWDNSALKKPPTNIEMYENLLQFHCKRLTTTELIQAWNSMSLTPKTKIMILNPLKSSFILQNWEIISPVNYTV